MRAIFKHDCCGCKLIGQHNGQDLYFCGQAGLYPTVIARYGNEGSEYNSGIESARSMRSRGMTQEPLVVALGIAEQLDLI